MYNRFRVAYVKVMTDGNTYAISMTTPGPKGWEKIQETLPLRRGSVSRCPSQPSVNLLEDLVRPIKIVRRSKKKEKLRVGRMKDRRRNLGQGN